MALGCIESVCLSFIANSIAIAPTVYSVPPPPSTRSFGQGQPGRQGAGGAWRLERGILRNARARRGGKRPICNSDFAIRTFPGPALLKSFVLAQSKNCISGLRTSSEHTRCPQVGQKVKLQFVLSPVFRAATSSLVGLAPVPWLRSIVLEIQSAASPRWVLAVALLVGANVRVERVPWDARGRGGLGIAGLGPLEIWASWTG